MSCLPRRSGPITTTSAPSPTPSSALDPTAGAAGRTLIGARAPRCRRSALPDLPLPRVPGASRHSSPGGRLDVLVPPAPLHRVQCEYAAVRCRCAGGTAAWPQATARSPRQRSCMNRRRLASGSPTSGRLAATTAAARQPHQPPWVGPKPSRYWRRRSSSRVTPAPTASSMVRRVIISSHCRPAGRRPDRHRPTGGTASGSADGCPARRRAGAWSRLCRDAPRPAW